MSSKRKPASKRAARGKKEAPIVVEADSAVAEQQETQPPQLARLPDDPMLIVSPNISDDDADYVMAGDDEVFLFPDAAELSADQKRTIKLGTMQDPNDESDSSEDEPTLNRIGDVPLEWYEDEEHVGYDVEGNRVMKPKKDALGELLDKTDDPNALRTIIDPQTGEKHILSNKDLQTLFNLQSNQVPNPDAHADYYADVPDVVQTEFDPLNHPLARSTGPSKKKFVPALHEMKKLMKTIRRMRKEDEEKEKQKDAVLSEKEGDEKPPTDEPYLLWDDDVDKEMDVRTKFKYVNRIPKPRKAPPGNYESYRPPAEYLPSEQTLEKWKQLRKIDRKEHFQPQMFQSLRHVPFYRHSIRDAYQRCLDLCAFPRKQRTRLVVDPDKLLPELPDPKDLKPYPERLAFLYKGHTATVRSISISPNGQYLATACDDHLVRIFETQTGRLMKRYDLGNVVQQVEFCPDPQKNIIAASVEFQLVFLVPEFCAHHAISEHSIRFLRAPTVTGRNLVEKTEGETEAGGEQSAHGHATTQATIDADETAYAGGRDLHDEAEKERRADFLDANAAERRAGIVVKVSTHARIKKFTWHGKGDYLCALCPKDHVKYRQTIMIQISRRKVFCPFRKFSEVVTDCRFHPSEPLFYLSTTNTVRCYNLMAHKMVKRYKAPGGVTTAIDLHPEGENFILGDTTNHTCWYDTNYSDKPYKRMKSHKSVVNAVAFHKVTTAFPLFASGASDGQVHIFHGMVYDDYNRNALIVPVKILKHNRPVYAIAWHPTLPWIFTSTEDGTVCCWTE